jgi:RNase adaptor protein for sRNA GlmZ degradation
MKIKMILLTKHKLVGALCECSENQYTIRMKNLLFLTGASGAGKTSTVEKLEQSYKDDIAYIHTDDFGVPSPEEMVRLYGGGNGYQRHIFKHWINYCKLHLLDSSAIVIEGSFKPSIIIEGSKEEDILDYKVLLFDCDNSTRTERLTRRGHPDIATPDMMRYAQILRTEAVDNNIPIVDTTYLTLNDTSDMVMSYLHLDDMNQT